MIAELEFLQKIEFQPNYIRHAIILAILPTLSDLQSPQVQNQSFTKKKRQGSNIIVSFTGQSTRKFIIGAHYDIWPKSGGINDNGAAVYILLQLIQYLSTFSKLQYSYDFVFFDWEEKGLLGSKFYLENASSDEIIEMINLDMCGLGDTLLFNQTPASEIDLATQLKTICLTQNLKYQILPSLPPGDNLSFEKQGISAVSIAIAPLITIPLIKHLALLFQYKGLTWKRIKSAMAFMIGMIKGYPLLDTMHTKKDIIETISSESMAQVFTLVSQLLLKIENNS